MVPAASFLEFDCVRDREGVSQFHRNVELEILRMMNRIENTIPAIAPARGAFKRARIKVASCSIISSKVTESSCETGQVNVAPQRIMPLKLASGGRWDGMVENWLASPYGLARVCLN